MNQELIKYIDLVNNITSKINSSNSNVYYTGIFKNKKNVDIPNKFDKDDKWDYLLFTNITDLDTSWTIINVPLFNECPILTNRIFKWLTHIFLKDYTIVFYMDGFFSPKLNININTDSIIQKIHRKRNCVYKELKACCKSKKISKSKINNIKNYLQKNSCKNNIGLYHNDIFIRNNKNIVLNKCSEEMINLMVDTSFYRDQPLLPFIYNQNKFKPTIDNNLNRLVCSTGSKINHTYT